MAPAGGTAADVVVGEAATADARDGPEIKDAAFVVGRRSVVHLGATPVGLGDRDAIGLEVRGNDDAEEQEAHREDGGVVEQRLPGRAGQR